jgi:outer membrane PBP1 activator LpoA protein
VKAIALLVVLAGCAASPPEQAPPPLHKPVDTGGLPPEQLLSRARTAPADAAAGLYLEAAWAYLDAGDEPGARAAFADLEPGWLAQAQMPDYELLRTRLKLADGDLAGARRAFDQVTRVARGSRRAELVESALCRAEGHYDCALTALIRATAGDPSANEEIWQLLNEATSLSGLNRPSTGEPMPGSDELIGWRSLHRALVTAFSAADAHKRVTVWLKTNPKHPASLAPPGAVADFAGYHPARQRIGLLLPLSGQLARAGEAVRDGFISAALIAGGLDRLELTIYDTAAEPLPVIYERALADRAQMLVGPLQKNTVTELNGLNPDLPVLVLNYLDAQTIPAAELEQVGLAIEDEATTITHRLEQDGMARVLLFHNYEDWSVRARRVLVEEANSTGRIHLTVQPFTDVRTVTEAVGNAMHVAGSRERRDELAGLLGEQLEFVPRAREDVDAVVALITNSEANALVPALRFHFAEHLPVYASSQTTRTARSGQLAELDGFHVSELPWFLGSDPVYSAMAAPFNLDRNPYASLVALGSDAYRLAERIHVGTAAGSVPLLGSTGLLSPASDGRIRRELAWGVISGERIRPEGG